MIAYIDVPIIFNCRYFFIAVARTNSHLRWWGVVGTDLNKLLTAFVNNS